MKKFSFSLEKVLNYKEQIESSLRTEYGQAIHRVRQKEAEISELDEKFKNCRAEFEKGKAEGISIDAIKRYETYLFTLTGRIANEKKLLKELEREAEEKRRQVIEAKQETSSIELLKDKRLDEYRAEALKQEERSIEEFVSNRSIAAGN